MPEGMAGGQPVEPVPHQPIPDQAASRIEVTEPSEPARSVEPGEFGGPISPAVFLTGADELVSASPSPEEARKQRRLLVALGLLIRDSEDRVTLRVDQPSSAGSRYRQANPLDSTDGPGELQLRQPPLVLETFAHLPASIEQAVESAAARPLTEPADLTHAETERSDVSGDEPHPADPIPAEALAGEPEPADASADPYSPSSVSFRLSDREEQAPANFEISLRGPPQRVAVRPGSADQQRPAPVVTALSATRRPASAQPIPSSPTVGDGGDETPDSEPSGQPVPAGSYARSSTASTSAAPKPDMTFVHEGSAEVMPPTSIANAEPSTIPATPSPNRWTNSAASRPELAATGDVILPQAQRHPLARLPEVVAVGPLPKIEVGGAVDAVRAPIRPGIAEQVKSALAAPPSQFPTRVPVTIPPNDGQIPAPVAAPRNVTAESPASPAMRPETPTEAAAPLDVPPTSPSRPTVVPPSSEPVPPRPKPSMTPVRLPSTESRPASTPVPVNQPPLAPPTAALARLPQPAANTEPHSHPAAVASPEPAATSRPPLQPPAGLAKLPQPAANTGPVSQPAQLTPQVVSEPPSTSPPPATFVKAPTLPASPEVAPLWNSPQRIAQAPSIPLPSSSAPPQIASLPLTEERERIPERAPPARRPVFASPTMNDGTPLHAGATESGRPLETHREVELIVRQTATVRIGIEIERTQVVDPAVCEVIQFSPLEFSLIGKGEGATHVRIWFKGAAQSTNYLVTVISATEYAKLNREACARLSQTIRDLYPSSQVELVPQSGELILQGSVADREQATQILALVRKVQFAPVVDRLKIEP